MIKLTTKSDYISGAVGNISTEEWTQVRDHFNELASLGEGVGDEALLEGIKSLAKGGVSSVTAIDGVIESGGSRVLEFVPDEVNTGALYVNYKNVAFAVKRNGVLLEGGELKVGEVYTLFHTGTSYDIRLNTTEFIASDNTNYLIPPTIGANKMDVIQVTPDTNTVKLKVLSDKAGVVHLISAGVCNSVNVRDGKLEPYGKNIDVIEMVDANDEVIPGEYKVMFLTNTATYLVIDADNVEFVAFENTEDYVVEDRIYGLADAPVIYGFNQGDHTTTPSVNNIITSATSYDVKYRLKYGQAQDNVTFFTNYTYSTPDSIRTQTSYVDFNGNRTNSLQMTLWKRNMTHNFEQLRDAVIPALVEENFLLKSDDPYDVRTITGTSPTSAVTKKYLIENMDAPIWKNYSQEFMPSKLKYNATTNSYFNPTYTGYILQIRLKYFPGVYYSPEYNAILLDNSFYTDNYTIPVLNTYYITGAYFELYEETVYGHYCRNSKRRVYSGIPYLPQTLIDINIVLNKSIVTPSGYYRIYSSVGGKWYVNRPLTAQSLSKGYNVYHIPDADNAIFLDIGETGYAILHTDKILYGIMADNSEPTELAKDMTSYTELFFYDMDHVIGVKNDGTLVNVIDDTVVGNNLGKALPTRESNLIVTYGGGNVNVIDVNTATTRYTIPCELRFTKVGFFRGTLFAHTTNQIWVLSVGGYQYHSDKILIEGNDVRQEVTTKGIDLIDPLETDNGTPGYFNGYQDKACYNTFKRES